MAFIILPDREEKEQLRSQMRENMRRGRSGGMRRVIHSGSGDRTFHEGYREGYKHGWEDSEYEMGGMD